MPFATSPELRSPWVEFLSEVDRKLPGPVELHCLGGFVVAMHYGLSRPTADVDYIEIKPHEAMEVLEEIAGKDSHLAKKHGLYFQHVGIVTPPESYADRLLELFPGRFQNLHLFALEAHDLALCKLERNLPVDRDDVAHLAKTVPLDPAALRERYEQELRPNVIGDVDRHDRTLAMWIAAYFPSRT
ncbi:MAG: DUF6036 family nucleotidyltransferase [Candidatus Methylomirabilales bacterium]